MNFFKPHRYLNSWYPSVIVLVGLLALNTGATFHSGLDTGIGLANLFFTVLWTCSLIYQLAHKPRQSKSDETRKSKVYYSPTQPTDETSAIGDLWFDFANGNAMYTYTESKGWIKVSDGKRVG